MKNYLHKLLAPAPAITRKIVFTRPSLADGKDYAEGDEGTFGEATAARLIASDAGYDPNAEDAASQRTKHLNQLLPPPISPEAIPEAWKALPAPFAAWWKLNAEYEALAARRDAIWEPLLSRMRSYVLQGDFRSIASQPKELKRRIMANLSGGFHIGEIPEEHAREIRYLKDAYQRAEQACRDWQEQNGTALMHQKILCGDHLQAQHGNLCKSIRELHAIALETFAHRVGALGLTDWKIRELFSGSSLAQEIAEFQEPTLQDLRLAYYDSTSGARHYIDQSVPAMAGTIRGFEKFSDRVTAATKKTKAELEKTRKAAA